MNIRAVNYEYEEELLSLSTNFVTILNPVILLALQSAL
jgi:hypothetical protein